MKKNLLVLSIFLALLQIIFTGEANAQANNPRQFNERFVVESVRKVFSAEVTFQSTVGAGLYASLAELRQADFIDAALASGEKYGYLFVLSKTATTATSPAKFYLTATPRSYPKTGRRSFYIDETGEMRAADKNGGVAGTSDPIISECDSFGVYSNERCTVIDLRKVMIAQMTYYVSFGNNSYGTLSQLLAAGLIPARIAAGTSHGYTFTVELVNATFKLRATPTNYGVTGVRSFYIDSDSIMRGADRQGQPADQTDPPINF